MAVPIDEAKGQKDGICARGACKNGRATWRNSVTLLYYCTSCARKLNEFTKLNGWTICTNESEEATR